MLYFFTNGSHATIFSSKCRLHSELRIF